MNIRALRTSVWSEQQSFFNLLLEQEKNIFEHSSCLIEAVKHQVLSRGKRIRAVLPLFTYQYLSSKEHTPLHQESETNAKWAGLSLELLHSSTLCHDDVMDGDLLRREVPTVWSIYGIPQAINAGNLLMYLSEEAIHRTQLAEADKLMLLKSISLYLRKVIHGQSAEIQLRQDHRLPPMEVYSDIVSAKTGGLFALGLLFGGTIAQLETDQIQKLEQLGLKLGEIFQIQDDIIDLLGNKGRGKTGNDLWEGKPSWFMAYVAKKLTQKEAEILSKILYIPREQKTEEDVQWIYTFLEQKGALEAGQAFLNEYSTVLQKMKNECAEYSPLIDHLLSLIQLSESDARQNTLRT